MEKYVKIINIIDRSGSMESKKSTTIESFNEFIDAQKQVDGKATVTTILFSNLYKKLYENVDLFKCPLLNNENYNCGGSTALYSTICTTIETEINNLGNIPLEERPNKTLCIISTDGEENSSIGYTRENVKQLISEMRNDFNWEFIFLGVDENTALTADGLGISIGNSFQYSDSKDGIRTAYANINKSTTVYRNSSATKMDNLLSSDSK